MTFQRVSDLSQMTLTPDPFVSIATCIPVFALLTSFVNVALRVLRFSKWLIQICLMYTPNYCWTCCLLVYRNFVMGSPCQCISIYFLNQSLYIHIMSSLNRIICLVVLICATNYAVFNSRKAFEQRWHEQELLKNHFWLLETPNIVANIKITWQLPVSIFSPKQTMLKQKEILVTS